jgi:hypothetical protein
VDYFSTGIMGIFAPALTGLQEHRKISRPGL